MLAASSSSAMVQSVSISSVRPVVRSRTSPETKPTSAGDGRGEQQARDRLGPDAVEGQQPDRVGAGAEEGRVAERDDAGIAEREIERKREQDRDQQLGAEAEIVREREIERERQRPRAAPPTSASRWRVGERARRRRTAGCGRRRGARSCLSPPNRPCGRHSSSRMVST